MESTDVTEGLNEWEQISPSHQSHSSAASGGATAAPVAVIRDNHLQVHNESPVFPPINQEGLPIPPQNNQNPLDLPQESNSSPFLSESPSTDEDEVGPGGIGQRLRSHLGVLSSGIVRAAYAVRKCVVFRVGLWPFVCVTGALVVTVLYLKVRRWGRRLQRENDGLIRLVNEKDKQISQLLLQIARMNEILSTRRRVPMFRVGRVIAS